MQQCTAYQIVRQVYSQIGEKEVIFLPMPMIKDREKLIEIHDEDAAFTAEKLMKERMLCFYDRRPEHLFYLYVYTQKTRKGWDMKQS